MTTRAEFNEIQRVTDQIRPLLAGRGPDIQGAVLADLVSMWLAGHQCSAALREEILALHVETVRALTPVNLALLNERLDA